MLPRKAGGGRFFGCFRPYTNGSGSFSNLVWVVLRVTKTIRGVSYPVISILISENRTRSLLVGMLVRHFSSCWHRRYERTLIITGSWWDYLRFGCSLPVFWGVLKEGLW